MSGDRLATAPTREAIAVWAEAHRLGFEDLAGVLRLQTHALRLLLERRWLTWETANEIAVALGCHPYEIWPGWFDTQSPAGRRSRPQCGRDR